MNESMNIVTSILLKRYLKDEYYFEKIEELDELIEKAT